MAELGKSYVLEYPNIFTTLPEYTAHNGQRVTVVRPLSDAEGDCEWEVKAEDGWIGHAFDDELVEEQ